MKTIGAIILAAGRGKRMKAKAMNKVAMPLANKPMVTYSVDLLTQLAVSPIIVVVGYAKESVKEILKNKVMYAEQKKRLGTAHAVSCAISIIPKNVRHVIVMYGDDFSYNAVALQNLIQTHETNKAALTFLTVEVDHPHGLGRVVRDESGRVVAIVEEKDATERQKKIHEVNPGCYIFQVDFLKKYLKKVKKNAITGEYYLTDLIDIAITHNEIVEAVPAGKIAWRGVNTIEELREAEQLYNKQARI